MAITKSTELEAVNEILASIGTAPLDSLSGDLGIDAEMARDKLNNEVRRICSKRWYFNTEHDYPLTANGSGEITPGGTILTVDLDPRTYPGVPVVLRGTKVYDLKEHSYTSFTADETYKATVTLLLQFDELPEAARLYAMVKAGQRFQSDTVGSEALFKFDEYEAQDAMADLEAEDARQADHNIFQGQYIGQTPANTMRRRSH